MRLSRELFLKNMNLTPEEKLVAAIVQQAILDLYYELTPWATDAMHFLKSPWFTILTGIDSDYLLDEIKKEGLNV